MTNQNRHTEDELWLIFENENPDLGKRVITKKPSLI